MSPWWGDYEIDIEQTLRWQIGPKTLWITRGDKEWRITTAEGRDHLDNRLTIAEAAERPVGEGLDVRRFSVRGEDRTIRLVPALPDRPMIVKAEEPFFIPMKDEVTLYVSAPLWLGIYAAGSDSKLVDVSLIQPSDTWFGPDTLSGELCYASRSSARLHLENLPERPHRSVSALHIRNSAKSVLAVEKLKVPVQHLGLFVSEGGHLWTEALKFEREEDTEEARIRIDKRPAKIGYEIQVATARMKKSSGFLLDAFGGLISKLREK